jgi:hypothetical protein
MKTRQIHYPSPLGRMQGEHVDIDAVKQRGWQDQHILVVSDDDERLDVLERAVVRKIGNRLYGGPAKGGQHG